MVILALVHSSGPTQLLTGKTHPNLGAGGIGIYDGRTTSIKKHPYLVTKLITINYIAVGELCLAFVTKGLYFIINDLLSLNIKHNRN